MGVLAMPSTPESREYNKMRSLLSKLVMAWRDGDMGGVDDLIHEANDLMHDIWQRHINR